MSGSWGNSWGLSWEGWYQPDSGDIVLAIASSTGAAGRSHAVGSFQVVAAPAAAEAVGGPVRTRRKRAKQRMHVWDFQEPIKVQVTAKSAAAGAAGVSHARASWLLVVKGKSKSSAAPGRSRARVEAVDVELQEFMELALALAA